MSCMVGPEHACRYRLRSTSRRPKFACHAVPMPTATIERALVAAQAVAREHGVACDEAVRIAAGSNVLVHLKPAPVVARVMTGTAVLHDDVEQWLAREVAVGAFLAETEL